MWCITELTREYVERMLDVLEVYERPYDPKRPVVCFDEKAVAIHAEKKQPLSRKPGTPQRSDYEYVRNGTAKIFVAVEPKGKKRRMSTTKRRTSKDTTEFLRKLIEEDYTGTGKIVIVMDNLNTHTKKAFTDTYGDKEGTRLWERLEVHYTPKHASWLNMAEIEISVLEKQCLGDRRFGSIQKLRAHVKAHERRRNREQRGITWSFTQEKAKEKFHLNNIPVSIG